MLTTVFAEVLKLRTTAHFKRVLFWRIVQQAVFRTAILEEIW
jgi:hypothetical protein